MSGTDFVDAVIEVSGVQWATLTSRVPLARSGHCRGLTESSDRCGDDGSLRGRRARFDVGIGTGKVQVGPLVAIVGPAHEIWRAAVDAVALFDHGSLIAFTDVGSPDDQEVTDLQVHTRRHRCVDLLDASCEMLEGRRSSRRR